MKKLVCVILAVLLLVPVAFAYSSWGSIEGTKVEYNIKEFKKSQTKNNEGVFSVEFKSNYDKPITLSTSAYFMDSHGKIYGRAIFISIPIGAGSTVVAQKNYLADGTFEEAVKAYNIVFKDTLVREIK